MESWIMRSWLESHDESEWPDLSICQTEDACHVTDMKSHPSKEVIEKMCSDEFFTKHKYKYVDVPSVTIRDDEDDDYSCCPKVGNPEADKCLDISSNYDVTPNPVERDHKSIAVYQDPKEPDGNESGYLCPAILDTIPPIRAPSRDLGAREVTPRYAKLHSNFQVVINGVKILGPK